MAVKFGSILHLNNSGSEATLDANNLRGTTIQVDSLNSASLATIGSGLEGAPGKRRVGTIICTTGSLATPPAYYMYTHSGSADANLSGSEWTDTTKWKKILGEGDVTGGGGSGIFNEVGSTGVFEATSSLSISGSVTISGSIVPTANNTHTLGEKGTKFKQVWATDTFFGGVHELNLKTPGLENLPLGTILVWKNGALAPCNSEADYMVMGVAKPPSDCPVILGAEPILVTGDVQEGDFIITSAKEGHGMGVKQNWLFKKDLVGKVIAQALESCSGESNVIKAMIRKM